MEDLKKTLIAEANSKFQNIAPCRGPEDFSECFTVHNGKLVLWFNVEGNSTRILMSESNREINRS